MDLKVLISNQQNHGKGKNLPRSFFNQRCTSSKLHLLYNQRVLSHIPVEIQIFSKDIKNEGTVSYKDISFIKKDIKSSAVRYGARKQVQSLNPQHNHFAEFEEIFSRVFHKFAPIITVKFFSVPKIQTNGLCCVTQEFDNDMYKVSQ